MGAAVAALVLSACTGTAPVGVPTTAPAPATASSTTASSTTGSPTTAPSTTALSTTSPSTEVPAPSPGTAEAALAELPVAERAPSTGYSRDAFGQRWADVDRNGCDTRNDVLARDLTDLRFRDGSTCVVVSGTLADPYTGAVLPFVRDDGTADSTSDDIQIDHVVALAGAWRTGAQTWDEATRTAFANDPMNLLAVDGAINQAKGDSDAAGWLPPAAAERCPFVARQIAVKQRYGAWVTTTERDAMAAVLRTCPAEPVPASPAPPVAPPDPSGTSSAITPSGNATVDTTPTTADPPPVDGCLIKGNINREGEKIYHVPGSRSYDETRIDVDRGERWFCTEADALNEGWRAPLG